MKEKVGLYVRVSTQEQAKEGYSVGEQTDRLGKYADAHDWTVYKTYTDPGFSGGDTNRPGLQEMLKDIRKGRINKVVVYKLDRLSRSQKDTLELIEDEFLANGVDFVSMSENFDTSTPFGRAIVGILAVFAQLEREQIKERMIMGKDARAKEGKWNGGAAVPFGYEYIGGELIINAFEALQVREAYEMALAGTSAFAIAEKFNEKGYRTRRKALWGESSIKRILKSRTYLGELKWGNEWHEALQEPIIDEKLYEEVQHVLSNRAGKYAHRNRSGKATTYLGGYLHCGCCGAKYNKHISRKKRKEGGYYKYELFECNSRTKKRKNLVKDPNCRNNNWKVEELTNQVFGEIKQLALDPGYINDIKDSKTDNRPQIIQGEIEKMEKQISKMMDLYIMDEMPKEVLQEKIHALNEQKEKMENEKEAIQQEIASKLSKEQTLQIAKGFPEILERGDFDEIRNVVSELIDKVVITGEDITIHWNF